MFFRHIIFIEIFILDNNYYSNKKTKVEIACQAKVRMLHSQYGHTRISIVLKNSKKFDMRVRIIEIKA